MKFYSHYYRSERERSLNYELCNVIHLVTSFASNVRAQICSHSKMMGYMHTIITYIMCIVRYSTNNFTSCSLSLFLYSACQNHNNLFKLSPVWTVHVLFCWATAAWIYHFFHVPLTTALPFFCFACSPFLFTFSVEKRKEFGLHNWMVVVD